MDRAKGLLSAPTPTQGTNSEDFLGRGRGSWCNVVQHRKCNAKMSQLGGDGLLYRSSAAPQPDQNTLITCIHILLATDMDAYDLLLSNTSSMRTVHDLSYSTFFE